MDVIIRALAGEALPWAFVLKILFTAISLGSGFKGGEIVPTFFIGATFGCIAAQMLGLDPGFGAALGMIALFCSVTNSPTTSIVLSVEMFGSGNLIIFAIVCVIGFVLSGNSGLYSSQTIVYSKTSTQIINRKAG
jgi:H+/Cl- antiporter ClcA